MTGLWVLLAAVVLALLVGVPLRRRSGKLRPTTAPAAATETELLRSQLADAGLPPGPPAPLILHFSAAWCGPCAAVRDVVAQLAAELPAVAHLEVDVTEHPAFAEALKVLSLPTVVVYDAELQQRFRAAGAPTLAGLRAAVLPLTDGCAAPDSAAE